MCIYTKTNKFIKAEYDIEVVKLVAVEKKEDGTKVYRAPMREDVYCEGTLENFVLRTVDKEFDSHPLLFKKSKVITPEHVSRFMYKTISSNPWYEECTIYNYGAGLIHSVKSFHDSSYLFPRMITATSYYHEELDDIRTYELWTAVIPKGTYYIKGMNEVDYRKGPGSVKEYDEVFASIELKFLHQVRDFGTVHKVIDDSRYVVPVYIDDEGTNWVKVFKEDSTGFSPDYIFVKVKENSNDIQNPEYYLRVYLNTETSQIDAVRFYEKYININYRGHFVENSPTYFENHEFKRIEFRLVYIDNGNVIKCNTSSGITMGKLTRDKDDFPAVFSFYRNDTLYMFEGFKAVDYYICDLVPESSFPHSTTYKVKENEELRIYE